MVRVSGPDAIRITDSIFKSASNHPLASASPYTLSYKAPFGIIFKSPGEAWFDEMILKEVEK